MIMNSRLMIEDDTPASRQDDESPRGDEQRPQIVRSEDLLHGRRELWIEHGEEMYRLRLTRAGKLYLTK